MIMMKRTNLCLVHLLCLVLIVIGSSHRQSSPAAGQEQFSRQAGNFTATPGTVLPEPWIPEFSRQTELDGRPLNAAERSQITEAFHQQPLRFEANLGQTDAEVKFLARGLGYSLFLTANEAVFSLSKDDGGKSETSCRLSPFPSRLPPPCGRASQTALRMKLLGANRAARVSGQ